MAKPKGKRGKGGDLRLISAVGGGLTALVIIGLGWSTSTPAAPQKRAAAAPASLYESGLSAAKMDGESVSISSFKGKALLMLNVASLYGDTLEILLFPSDEFHQELPSEQIPTFVQQQGLPTDGGGCTLMAKVDINGPATAPLWAYAKRVNRVASIGWNFDGIFLFDRWGQPQGRYHRGDLPGADAALRRILG